MKTIYEGRDACSTSKWKTESVSLAGEAYSNDYIQVMLTDLKPFTVYAIYVDMDVLDTASHSSQSQIIYVKTNAAGEWEEWP